MTYIAWGFTFIIALALLLGSLVLISIAADFIMYGDSNWKAYIVGVLGVAIMAVAVAGLFFAFDTTQDNSVHCKAGTMFVEHQGDWWCEPK